MIQPNQPREDNYRDVSCQKCGHIPASENHLCDNQPREEWEALFIEEGASLEHARWSKWHIYMRDKWTPENIERWNRQAVTPYSELSEKEKESDRREVREYLPLITNLLAAERAALREKVKKLPFEVKLENIGQQTLQMQDGKYLPHKPEEDVYLRRADILTLLDN